MDLAGHAARQPQHHGDVVRRKRPEAIFLAANSAQIQAVGVEIQKAAQRTLADHLVQPVHRRVILQQVADHQHALFLPRQRDERRTLRDMQRQWLLDKDVLVALQKIISQFSMLCGRCGDRDGQIGGDFVARRHHARVRVELLRRCPGNGIGIADRGKCAQSVEIAGNIAAPRAKTDERDLDGWLVLRHGHLARRV